MALNLRGIEIIKAGLADAIDAGTHRAADYIGDLAQQLAPEDTGDLKSSKQVTQEAPGVWRVSFGADLPDIRALAQEFGTVDQPAQPYLTPASREIDTPREVTLELRKLLQRSRIR